MLKKSLLVLLCLCLVMAGGAFPRTMQSVKASGGTSLSEDKQRLAELQNKLNNLKGKIQQLKKDRQQNTETAQTMFEEKKQLEMQRSDIEKEYRYINEQLTTISDIIDEYTEIIENAEKEGAELDSKLDSQLNDFGTVLVELYKNGDDTKFEIFLRSDSYSSYVSYVEYMENILKSSNNMINDITKTIKDIDDRRQEHEDANSKLKEKKEELNAAKAELEEKDDELVRKDGELDEKLGKEREKLELNDKEKDEMQKDEEELRKEIQALQNEIKSKLSATYTGKFSWPFASNVSYHISSRFGWRTDNPLSGGKKEFHNGIDIACAKNTAIHAVDGGIVTYAGYRGGFGNVIFLEHGGGFTTVYAHCQSLLVTAGTRVLQDQTIARVGSTGKSTGNHLHFGVLKDGSYVNPEKYLPGFYLNGH